MSAYVKIMLQSIYFVVLCHTFKKNNLFLLFILFGVSLLYSFWHCYNILNYFHLP